MKSTIETTNQIYPTLIEVDEYEETTDVDIIFRVWNLKIFNKAVFALFPHEVADHKGNITCYQHLGQHGSADYRFCINSSRPATESEYSSLKREMEGLGYNISIVKKQQYAKYLKSYKLARK